MIIPEERIVLSVEEKRCCDVAWHSRDPETLAELCAHESRWVRVAAMVNPACPDEGRVIAALLNAHLPD